LSPEKIFASIFFPHFAAMGYVPQGGFADVVMIALYDGAGTGIRVPDNIGIVTPANKYQDGIKQSVGKKIFLLNIAYS
jgi:hypothetical protein